MPLIRNRLDMKTSMGSDGADFSLINKREISISPTLYAPITSSAELLVRH